MALQGFWHRDNEGSLTYWLLSGLYRSILVWGERVESRACWKWPSFLRSVGKSVLVPWYRSDFQKPKTELNLPCLEYREGRHPLTVSAETAPYLPKMIHRNFLKCDFSVKQLSRSIAREKTTIFEAWIIWLEDQVQKYSKTQKKIENWKIEKKLKIMMEKETHLRW